LSFRCLYRYACHKYKSCTSLARFCTSNNDEKIHCLLTQNCEYDNIDRCALFKIGDEVEINNEYHNVCSAMHHLGGPNHGIITAIDYNSHLPILVKHYKYNDTWYHMPECLKPINKGFNPNEIISKAFGV